MGLFDFLKKLFVPPETITGGSEQPTPDTDASKINIQNNPERSSCGNDSLPSDLYNRAKALSQCLFDFPYINPASVPLSVQEDKPLMDIIVSAHHTTIGNDGKTRQTTMGSEERRRYQEEFKKRIYELLDKCLSADPEYAPAILLYQKVAERNTTATDWTRLLELYDRLLPYIETVKKGTRAYSLIGKDIEGFLNGNYFDQVERHLADFHYELGQLYIKVDRFPDAITQLERAETLMPPIYAGSIGKAYAEVGEYEKALEHMERSLKVNMEKRNKDFLKSDYKNIKAMMKEAAEETGELHRIAEKVIPIISQTPGILQKDLFTQLPSEDKRTISGILRTLEQESLITRKKKGSTYQLFIEGSASEVLEQAKDIEF